MIVFDASVVIALLSIDDALHERAQKLLSEHVDRPSLIHVLTRAEVLVAPTRAGRQRAAEEQLDALRLRTVDLGAAQASDLAALRVETALKLPDCCVILAASMHRAAVASFDERLIRAARSLSIPTIEG